MANGSPPGKGYKVATWILGVLVVLLTIWQIATWMYLRGELAEWLKNRPGGDGTYPPPPPPKF